MSEVSPPTKDELERAEAMAKTDAFLRRLRRCEHSTPNEVWHARFLSLAREVAGWSKFPDKTGAVIVDHNNRVVSTGYCGFPRGMGDAPHLLGDRDARKRLGVHAEVNAILWAKKDIAGLSLYSTRAPCISCAVVIMNSGLLAVHSPQPDQQSSYYQGQVEAMRLMKQAGIEVFAWV